MTTADPIPHLLLPPELVRRSHWEDPNETRVANWIRPWDGEEDSGFVQAEWHTRWGRDRGVTIFTARDVATKGIEPILEQALSIASRDIDAVYVTFDIDCFDQAYAPGTGASLPGGLTPWQGYDSLFRLGRQSNVMGLDLVELDPSRDVFDITVRLANKLLLTFLAGYKSHP